MTRFADVVIVTSALVVGAVQAGASPLITLSNLELGGEPDEEMPESATTPAALTLPEGADPNTLGASGPAGQTFGLMQEESSGLAYPVTGSISLGVAYELEEAEDLAGTVIEAGAIQQDYENHSVILRAQWQFDTGK